jgi:hypothetical protein
MSKKTERAIHGPSWVEVILGAVLSVVLGVALGAILLVIKPVVTPKTREMPKEPVAGTTYYIEGSRDTAKAKQALAKRKAFAAGQSVAVNEDELNSLIEPATPAAPTPPPPKAGEKAKAPEKGKEAAPAAAGELFSTGTPNFRIQGGTLQIGAPVTVTVLGFSEKVIAQARGGFVKQGDQFVFDPDSFYLGSCPLQRLPFLSGYVKSKVLSSQKIPEDIAAAWPKLANVSIDGTTLKLDMP